jgi:hypothetical protein
MTERSSREISDFANEIANFLAEVLILPSPALRLRYKTLFVLSRERCHAFFGRAGRCPARHRAEKSLTPHSRSQCPRGRAAANARRDLRT